MLDSNVVENIKKILKHVFTSGNHWKKDVKYWEYCFVFYIDQETKSQLIVFSETIPDSVRKLTKKYLSADLVTINLAKKTAQEASAADDEEEEEVKIQ